MLRAGILASLHDTPEGVVDKVEVPKSSVSSIRLVHTVHECFFNRDLLNAVHLSELLHFQVAAVGEDGLLHRESCCGSGRYRAAGRSNLSAYWWSDWGGGCGHLKRKEVIISAIVLGYCFKLKLYFRIALVSFDYLSNSLTKNENLLKLHLLSGHPKCRLVCFFIGTDLEKCSITSFGCHQNESPNSWHPCVSSPTINISWMKELCVCNKHIIKAF